MKIWVDADACPVVIKEILFRTAKRTKIELSLVANRPVKIPAAANISFVRVAPGLDVADNEIVKRLSPGDLVITADIPLAAEVIDKGGYGLNPRGELYTAENVRERLSMRDFMTELRAGGMEAGGPPPLTVQDKQRFANSLDRFLNQHNHC